MSFISSLILAASSKSRSLAACCISRSVFFSKRDFLPSRTILKARISRAYCSGLICRLQGAEHWSMDANKQGRYHFHFSSEASISKLQFRNLKMRCYIERAPCNFPGFVNCPYSRASFPAGSRVTSTRGKSSRREIMI